jgi:putative DNA primase/helicase
MLSAALRYAGHGINVFPVNERKEPLTPKGTPERPGGFHHATTDRTKIEGWWAKHPNAGIATPDYDVVDVDMYKPGGVEEWRRVKPLIPPGTPQQKTPRGGVQFFFTAGSLNGRKFSDTIDLRYAGRNYVLLPPSRFADHGRYEWVTSVLERKPKPAPDFPSSASRNEAAAPITDKIPYGRQHYELVSLAGSMRRRGMNASEIFAALWEVNVNRCERPGPEENIRQIAESVEQYQPASSGAADKPTTAYLRSDLGNAELLADRHASRLRHVKERRLWLTWEAGRWRSDTTGAAERAAKALARERLRAAADIENEDDRKKAVMWAMTSQSDSRIRAALSLATTETPIVLRAEDLDTDPFLLACANGTLDLRTAELRAPDPDDLITLGNDVAYDPDARCPRWDTFLEEVFDGDEELIGFVQRLAGYSLTGDIREQIVAVLHGGGNNGKDTLIKPLMRVVGEQAETSPMDTFTRVRDRSVRNDLARLHRARLVIASESAEGRRLDEPTIKLVSGGGRVAARFLYGEFFEFTPQFKVWLITNHRPRVDGDDDAIWRRLRLIPFNVSFLGREDKELDGKLEAELPGILAWAVRGSLEWQAEGLGLPPAVEEATREYRVDEDVLGTFIAERCILEGEIEPASLREAFDTFCAEIGERPFTAAVLGKRLARRGIRREGQNGAYRGIGLK